jgi:hypothetical protein
MQFIQSAKGCVLPIVAAMAAVTTVSLVAPAVAAPVSPATSRMLAPVKDAAVPIDRVQYRHWGWHHRPHWRHRPWGYRRHWRGYGPSVAGAIAGAIIGGTIIASQRDHRSAWEQCDATYRSFSWRDGTYQPYGDEPRRLCPYLAP